MNSMQVNPPIKYHGGKGYLAPDIHRIAKRTPYVHRVITHGGGLGELWNWEHEGISECVNDINGWLANLWNVLRDLENFERFRRHVEAIPFSEPVWQDAEDFIARKGKVVGIDAVEAAVWFFVLCRQSMAGRLESFAPLSRNRTRRNMNEQASAWLTAIEGLPAVHKRLSRVVVFNKDAVELIRQQDGANTLFYCDPPYVPDSRTAPDIYRFEMTIEQHGALLDTLGGITGKFILSGYDCDLYRNRESVYNWRREEFDLPNNAASGASKRRMTEVIWSNF